MTRHRRGSVAGPVLERPVTIEAWTVGGITFIPVPELDLPYVVVDGTRRYFLRTKEAAQVTGVKYREIIAMINAGRVKVITGGRGYIIPADQLDEILAWAELAEFQREMRQLTGRHGTRM